PVAAGDVARPRAAEGEIQEFAGERGEIIPLGKFADLPVELAVEELLAIPEFGEPPGLAATIQLLDLLQVAQMRIIAEVAPVTIGDHHVELGMFEPKELLQVQLRRERPLIGVAPQLLVATLHVGRRLRDVPDVEVDPLLAEHGTQVIPVQEELLTERLWGACPLTGAARQQSGRCYGLFQPAHAHSPPSV